MTNPSLHMRMKCHSRTGNCQQLLLFHKPYFFKLNIKCATCILSMRETLFVNCHFFTFIIMNAFSGYTRNPSLNRLSVLGVWFYFCIKASSNKILLYYKPFSVILRFSSLSHCFSEIRFSLGTDDTFRGILFFYVRRYFLCKFCESWELFSGA